MKGPWSVQGFLCHLASGVVLIKSYMIFDQDVRGIWSAVRDEAPLWSQTRRQSVPLQKTLVGNRSRGRLEEICPVFHSWPVGWQSPKTHGIRTGGLGHQAATSAGAGCQQQPEAPHHSYDGICIKRRLQDQIATQQQPKLHFIPLLIAF